MNALDPLPPAPTASAAARVLVVDDNRSVLETLGYYLPTIGYGVVTAEDGRTALQIAAEETVHLMLLDVDMPRMNGFAVCEALRRTPGLGGLPVVMMTGRAGREIAASALAAGARGLLTKPFDLGVLQATIARHVAAQ